MSTFRRTTLSKSYILLSISLLAVGCATTEGYERLLNTWIGASEDQLASAWGPPHNVYVSPTGTRFLTYQQAQNVTLPGYTYTVPETNYLHGNIYGGGGISSYYGTVTSYETRTTAPVNLDFSCTTTFHVQNDRIVSWRYEGNNCVADFRETQAGSQAIKPIETLRVASKDASPRRESDRGLVKIRLKQATLRAAPSLDSAALGHINSSINLSAMEETDHWVLVETPDGRRGWIAKKWL
jgi:Bacterial SH3 domain